MYIAMLDQHDSSRRISANRGVKFGSVRNDAQEDEEDFIRAPGTKRPGTAFSVGQPSLKKQVSDKSLFAWLGGESTKETLLTPSQELTRKMVQNQTIDIKTAKRRILSAKRVPEFPNMEWNNILAGKAINLNIVFSGMYSTAMDSKTIENLGDLELHFGVAKPAKSVETHGDWIIAWRTAVTATKLVFPHRARELEEYSDYISSYFASVQPAGHSKIFNLDKAIRKRVRSVNDVSLNESGKFRYLETCYLHGHGAGESSASPKEKANDKSGAGNNWRKSEPCRLWNDGRCDKQALSCKYRHICKSLQGGVIAKKSAHAKKPGVFEHCGDHPRYAHELLWGLDEDEIGPTALYSDPLPRPPPSAFENKIAMKTISENPDIFKITCLIDVDAFERLLVGVATR
jgi:hypothetical protein